MLYRCSKGIPVLLGLIFLFNHCLYSQNLVINPGFEDQNTCEKGARCAPVAWYSTMNGGILGYFGKKAKRKAHHGDNFLSIILYNISTDKREYLITPLKCELEAGQSYVLRLYVRPGSYRINSFGAYFSDSAIVSGYLIAFFRKEPESKQLILEPQVKFDEENLLNLKKKWNKLEATFTATGNERFMTIGNFLSKEDIKVEKIRRSSMSNNLAFSIDDIELIPLNGRTCNDDQFIREVYNDYERHPYSTLFF